MAYSKKTDRMESPPPDYTQKYSDEYYEQYIENFQCNTKKRLGYRFIKRGFDIVSCFFDSIDIERC